MMFNNDLQQRNIQQKGLVLSSPNRIEPVAPPARPLTPLINPVAPGPGKRHRLRTALVVVVLIALLLGSVRLLPLAYDNNNQLLVRIGSQQSTLVDLRQSVPVSPYLLGTNVFPQAGTSSLDAVDSGFMNYGPTITNDLRDAHVKLLRFPGGSWGENHVYSPEQLNDFSTLLSRVGAEGMVQVQLSDPLNVQPDDLTARAKQAGDIVDYMNHLHSTQRTGKYAHALFHPIKFWTVGNEPDQLINPDTGEKFTVADYVKAFIQFSLVMHQTDPTIQVFGPEISQFYGLGTGLTDAQGQLWMEGFLKGVGEYEQQHPQLKFHILDGVSFHRYQFDDAHLASALLMSSTGEWNYLLPSLHQLIRQDFGHDLPVAITEINTNPNGAVPPRGLAALWWADTLGMLMNQQVDYVAFFSAEGVDKPYPLFDTHNLHETAMLRVMQLFSHFQRNLIPLDIQREPLSLYATQDDAHQTVSLLFVNKSSIAQLAQVSAQSTLPALDPWPNLNINIQGFSMLLVTLHYNGGAAAYSYIAPFTDNATAAPLSYTVCGNKTNSVANSVPC